MDFSEILARPDGPEKTAALAEWVQSLYGPGEEPPVLVGGGAVEFYSRGSYTTANLDFAGHVPAAVAKALRGKGFERHGRHYVHEAGQVYLEFPCSSLGPTELAVRR